MGNSESNECNPSYASCLLLSMHPESAADKVPAIPLFRLAPQTRQVEASVIWPEPARGHLNIYAARCRNGETAGLVRAQLQLRVPHHFVGA